MAISKNRLEELISKGSTVYTILQGGIEKVDLAKTRIFGRTNDYTFIDYWCDTFDQYIETSNERLFETRKEAEWHLKTHATRTEELNLPMWEEFITYNENECVAFVGEDWEVYELSNDIDIYHKPRILLTADGEYFKEWKSTEENYEKACDLCIKLFKGEEE